jgi:hypothetical protein
MRFSLSKYLSRFGTRGFGTRRRSGPANVAWKPALESLEDRRIPAILFQPGTVANTTGLSSAVITNVHPYLVFWGNGWNNAAGTTLRNNILHAVDGLLSSRYLTSLSEYRQGLGPGIRTGAVVETDSNPGPVFNPFDVTGMLTWGMRPGGPIPDPFWNPDPSWLYFVIPQPGSSLQSCLGFPCRGYHFGSIYPAPVPWPPFVMPTPYIYAVTSNDGTMDGVMGILSHELVESVTDPDGTGIHNSLGSFPENEIADNDAERYGYRYDGNILATCLPARRPPRP